MTEITLEDLLQRLQDASQVEIQIRKNCKLFHGAVEGVTFSDDGIQFSFETSYFAIYDNNENCWKYTTSEVNTIFPIEDTKITEADDGRIILVCPQVNIGELLLNGYKHLDPNSIGPEE